MHCVMCCIALFQGFLPADYPACVNEIGAFSSMHIYVTDSPLDIVCPV